MSRTTYKPDFSSPKTPFWKGFGSILSLGGNQTDFVVSKSGEEADFKALKSDWEMIGKDFYTVFQNTLK